MEDACKKARSSNLKNMDGKINGILTARGLKMVIGQIGQDGGENWIYKNWKQEGLYFNNTNKK